MPPQEAVDAFLAPSVMNPVSTSAGGGGGAGRPTFSDASVTLPFDLNVLSLLVEQADGVVTQSADVQIDGAGPAGPSAIGDVAFNNVQIHETTLSNLTATVTFGAQTFQWTFGTQTTTFP